MRADRLIDRVAFAVLLLAPAALGAQGAAGPEPIKDNSFLVEEAYNQEAGVVQHIGTFARARAGGWAASFTQEWPVFSIRHQLSATVPMQGVGEERGLGDVALNYRLQLAGTEGGPVAFAPRVSAVLPTGDADGGHGAGATGAQVNLPLSWQATRSLVLHANAGAAWTPRAQAPDGGRASSRELVAAQSIVWLAHPRLNLLVEGVYSASREPVADGRSVRGESVTINPGVRWSHDLPGGLQVVPGVAVPIGIGPSRGERAVFLYLSFEHPFGRQS